MNQYKTSYKSMMLVLSGLFCFCVACEMQQDIEVQLPEHEEEFVVECYLEPGKPYGALVTRSLHLFESAKLENVDSASVTITSSDGEEKIDLLNLSHGDTSFQKLYNYWHPDLVEYEEGKEYKIEVSYGDKLKVSGRTRFLPKVGLERIHFKYDEDSLASIFVDIKDRVGEENYYRLVMRGPDPKHGVSYDGVWSDEDATGGILQAYSHFHFQKGWTVAINLYHIDKDFYDFLNSVQKAHDSNYNPFMQPANIESTLDGATGVFTAISMTSDTIRVK